MTKISKDREFAAFLCLAASLLIIGACYWIIPEEKSIQKEAPVRLPEETAPATVLPKGKSLRVFPAHAKENRR